MLYCLTVGYFLLKMLVGGELIVLFSYSFYLNGFSFFFCFRRVKEMVQHLQAERVRLANEVSSLEQSNESLKAQLAKTKEKAQQKEQVQLEFTSKWFLFFMYYTLKI